MAKRAYYTQELIPEQKIVNGITELKDGRMIKIVEIMPINFNYRSEADKSNLVGMIMQWYRVAPPGFQLKIVTRNADASAHIEEFMNDVRKTNNMEMYKIAQNYQALVETTARASAISQRFFFVFSSDMLDGKSFSKEDTIHKLTDSALNCKRYWETCGHKSKRFKTAEEEDEWTRKTYYELYNRKSVMFDPLSNRMAQVDQMFKVSNKNFDPEAVPLSYYIAPRGMQTLHRHYIQADGMYYSFYYVPQDAHPVNIPAGYFGAGFKEAGIDMDIHVRKKDSAYLQEALSKRKSLSNKSLGADLESSYAKDMARKIEAIEFIQSALENAESLYNFSLIYTVSSHTLADLAQKEARLVNFYRGMGKKIMPCTYQQEQAYLSTCLQNKVDPNIWAMASRNITTSGLAALYPITAFEMTDESGIFLGINKDNRSAVIWDPFDTSKAPNANCTIFGVPGSGKTFTLALSAARMRLRGIPIFIIAPLKGYEFRRICKLFGGEYIKISPSSDNCLNVMDIRIPKNFDEDSTERLLSGEESVEKSLLAEKALDLKAFYRLVFPSITNVEQQLLDNYTMETYAQRGITTDNESLYLDKENGVLKQMPTLGDLASVVSDHAQTNSFAEKIKIMLSMFTEGSARKFDGQTNVDLGTGFTVFDLEDLGNVPELLPMGMLIATNTVKQYFAQDRTEKKVLFIDEFWSMIGAGAPESTAQFLVKMCKIVRGMSGAVFLATQDINDIYAQKDSVYGKNILNACATQMFMMVGDMDARQLADIFNLTVNEEQSIRKNQKGDMLFCTASGQKVPIHIESSPLETDAITTDRKLMVEVARKAKQKKEFETKGAET